MPAIDVESYYASFAQMVGFTRAGASWKYNVQSLEEVKALTEYETELKRLEQAQDVAGQYHLNRRLALGLRPVRLPSMQSIRGSGEAFAEIGSHLILDPRARTYLPQGVVTFFDDKVFRKPAE